MTATLNKRTRTITPQFELPPHTQLAQAKVQELLNNLERSIQSHRDFVANDLDRLVQGASPETRLAITCWVFRALHAHQDGGFRALIYQALGFDSSAYIPLYLCGGASVTARMETVQPEVPTAETLSSF